ncbi:DUF423 domain-containing protein [Parvularcula lutaonensis]|uniref:DUF423 domain-containing protein n=1 Tax=Parvularcula lutaonensis TaxID=491923 RepID=A0ABV7MAN0_9PROT|nr:DUF423 domain-containing protein [Parvularcula lutaonensis]
MKLSAIAGVLGFLAVALGAFGAHGLEDRLGQQELGWWQTATLYLLVHAAVSAALGTGDSRWHRAGWLMAAGAALFSGTLYAMALGAPTALGAITPVGGLLMLAGWASLVWSALRV